MYPISVNLQGKLVTIIGGGKIALRKAKSFLEHGARIKIISYAFEKAFGGMDVVCQVGPYHASDLDGSFMVVAATNDREVNEEIGLYCKEHSILCNVIDQPKLSSFTSQAYMRRGDLVIGVSTGGKSPSLAKTIKDELENIYDERYIEYLQILGRLRAEIISKEQDQASKKVKLGYLVTLDLEELKAYEKSYYGGELWDNG